MPLSEEEKKARNNIATKKYQQKNKEKIAAYRASRKEASAAYAREYSIAHRDKINAVSAKWYATNVDKVRADRAAYFQENKEVILKRHREWWRSNPEKVKSLKLQWKEANPERARVIGLICESNRRARKKASAGKLSADLALKLFKLQRGKCACCGKSLKDGYHLDHINPLALGGQNVDVNMQLLTPHCNLTKNMKDPIEYMQSKGLLL